MTSEEETQMWDYYAALATFDGRAEQIEYWANYYDGKIIRKFHFLREKEKLFLDRFSMDEMINIVKSMVLLSEVDSLSFGKGSVHPAIPIIALFRSKHPEECEELDAWVLEHSTNNWLPWGRGRSRFKSWREVQFANLKQEQNAYAEEERQQLERAAKRGRDKGKAQRNIYNAIRRKDVGAIEAMIAKGVDLDKPNDEGKSPRAYAKELGDDRVLSILKTESHPKTSQ